MNANRSVISFLRMVLALFLCIVFVLESGTMKSQAKANNISTLEELTKTRQSVYDAYVNSKSSRKNELLSGKIKIGSYTMTYSVQIIGKAGKNGYPIYFGLHGGGTTDTSIQKDQYELMQSYYSSSISSGIYIVPLSLEARYDEHYLPESYLFYDRLIEDAVLFHNGDANRVYMLGFSSGGDGVYAIAPVMADKLAAANMSAGYPTVHKLENLYNLPMCLQMGENDTAYDRNINVAKYDSWLNDLQKQYGNGFIHETYIHKNGTHNSWNDVGIKTQMVVANDSIAAWLKNKRNAKYVRTSTDAIKWVSQYTRNPLPEKIVWSTNINAKLRESKAFYWLDRDGYLDYSTIVASYDKKNNTISIEKCDATMGTLKIYLNQDMVDLFKDVKIKIAGKTYTVTPIISKNIMEATLAARSDINYMFDAEIDISLSDDSKKIKVEAVSDHDKSYEVTDVENLLRWNKDNLFLVDPSLFDLTYDQLCKKLGVKLPKVQDWTYWGNELSYTYYECDRKHSVMFLFQNKKTVIIYSEQAGAIQKSVCQSAASVLGAKFSTDGIPRTDFYASILAQNTASHFYIENNVYDNKDHMVQKYIYYKYQ